MREKSCSRSSFFQKNKFYYLSIIFVLLIPVLNNLFAQTEFKSGLVGVCFINADLTKPRRGELIYSLDELWNAQKGHSKELSAKWEGYLIAPATGEMTFSVRTNNHCILNIANKKIAEAIGKNSDGVGKIEMIKGDKYLITLIYNHNGEENGYQEIKWKWGDQAFVSVPGKNTVHSLEQENFYNWIDEPDLAAIDYSQYLKVTSKNLIVYKEAGRFAGWPANNGIWMWGNEILVGFEQGYFKKNDNGHSVDTKQPIYNVLGRSIDGGETWTIENPDNFVDDVKNPIPLTEEINFASSGFALRNSDQSFFISYDRGKKWSGPYPYPDFGKKLTSRTDYLVNGKNDCQIFLSAKEDNVVTEASYQDRSMCVRTTDGGKTFKFLGWMTGEPIEVRSVMSSTVRLSENQLVSIMRRRLDQKFNDRPSAIKNWIDAYGSSDNGITWNFLSKAAETDRGNHNGNPPSLVRLKDGRLCVTYGYRSVPYGIRAKISNDNGQSWSKEILLRDDALTWDIGYTRSVVRSDGKVVTIYYYHTKENPEHFLAATIWDASSISK